MYMNISLIVLQVLFILFVWSPSKLTTLMLKGTSLIAAKCYVAFDFFFFFHLQQFPK